MGNNAAYTFMESMIVTIYDRGLMERDLLCELMAPYSDTDVDSGGCMNLRSQDGLTAENIICKIMEPEKFDKIGPCKLTQEQIDNLEYGSDDWHEYDDWSDKAYTLYREITRREWNFY